MTDAKRTRGRFGLVITVLGFAYLAYVFVFSFVIVGQGIPTDDDYDVDRVTPQAHVFAFSCFYSFLPLVAIFITSLVLAIRSRRGHRDGRWRGNVSLILLASGFPLALWAFGVWYRMGW